MCLSHKWGERDPDAGLFHFKVHIHNDPLTLSSCHSDNQGDGAERVGSEASDLQSKCGFGEPLVACGVTVLAQRSPRWFTVFGMDPE